MVDELFCHAVLKGTLTIFFKRSHPEVFLEVVILNVLEKSHEKVNAHFVKSVCIRSYSGLHFPAFGEILCISPYSIRMLENADQNNSEYKRFLRSGKSTFLE